MKITTLCYLVDRKNSKILLAMKKRGLGAGKLNGPGGKVEHPETIEQGCIRECQEETGLTPHDLINRGRIEFLFEDKSGWDNCCHIFLAEKWTGTLQETEEMKPDWYPLDNIPYKKMWEDDELWIPKVLAGNSVYHRITFGEKGMLKFEDMPIN